MSNEKWQEKELETELCTVCGENPVGNQNYRFSEGLCDECYRNDLVKRANSCKILRDDYGWTGAHNLVDFITENT